MVGQTLIEETIVPTVPDQVTFSGFWDKVQEAGIMGLGYGVVKPVLKGKLQDDYRYVISPELSSTEGEPGALETLVQLLNYTIGRSGNGVLPYSYTSPQGNANENNGVWEITLVLWYNPSAPTLYLLLGPDAGGITLKVHNKNGTEVWEQIKEYVERYPSPYLANEKDLSEFVDTSVRNIYVLKRVNTHWQAINKQVVMTDR